MQGADLSRGHSGEYLSHDAPMDKSRPGRNVSLHWECVTAACADPTRGRTSRSKASQLAAMQRCQASPIGSQELDQKMRNPWPPIGGWRKLQWQGVQDQCCGFGSSPH